MKTVFITGGFTGIGAASVTKFINEGWNVSFMDINVLAVEELQSRINDPSACFSPKATLVSVPTSAVSLKLRWLASAS